MLLACSTRCTGACGTDAMGAVPPEMPGPLGPLGPLGPVGPLGARGASDRVMPIDTGAVRYFSLARHALAALLQAAGVGTGGRVLLPEYICRDLLASLRAVGAVPVYYPVDRQLAPASAPEHWPLADAVLMVDYFGFAQVMHPFEQYCERSGAVLIEDNAHGYLSRDQTGQWLGCRGDAGLFSLRKTLLLPNGAAFRLNKDMARWRPAAQLEEVAALAPLGIALRKRLHGLPGGRNIAARVAGMQRSMRRLRTGYALPQPAADAEHVIPGVPHPHQGLRAALAACDIEQEIARRRKLYVALEPRLQKCDAQPLHARLPDGAAPYGMPVYCHDAAALARVAGQFGLDSFRWPDLPDALAAAAPAHYRNLHVVNFL